MWMFLAAKVVKEQDKCKCNIEATLYYTLQQLGEGRSIEAFILLSCFY